MENKTVNMPLTTKALFGRDDVKQKFQDLLGKKSTAFITSVLQAVASNEMLAKADPHSIYHAAAVAAVLDLPLNSNLGFAYIIPYRDSKTEKVTAQFQMGYKGFIQLAQRSGQFQTISASPIYEGQLTETNPLTGFVFDFTKKKSDTVIGYASYFKLLNGFEKTFYMTVEDLKKHGVRFSKSFAKGYGLWKDDFDAMGIKTVLKLLLSKYAPLSIEMQKAVVIDQAIINDADTNDVTYVDNDKEEEALQLTDKEAERVALMIDDAKTEEELNSLAPHVKPEQQEIFDAKKKILQAKTRLSQPQRLSQNKSKKVA